MPRMDIRYLFDSTGRWIGFAEDNRVFDRSGAFLGWTPWNGDAANDVVTASGDYFGTILPEDRVHARLYALRSRPYRGYPGRPDTPDYPGYPGHPGTRQPEALPAGARDVDTRTRAMHTA